MKKTDTNKKRMLRALKKHKGLVVTAAKATGIHKSTHYAWYHDDDAYKDAVDELMDLEVEFVESKLQDLIDSNNPAGILFYLKNKSADYKPQLKIEGDIKTEITINPINIINPGVKED